MSVLLRLRLHRVSCTMSRSKEERALEYRDRWRYFGALSGFTVLMIGLCVTQRWQWVNLFWIIGAGLVWVISGMIGRVVYKRKTPW